jgi:2-methylisocitrate lyase-like PEP mutase family enzyme
LRQSLPEHPVLLAAGAHDALSAKLAEEAGFDAVWASGFGISAVQAVPDANILTLTETLDAVRRICDAVDIPVVADCDTVTGMRSTSCGRYEPERAGPLASASRTTSSQAPSTLASADLVPPGEYARK